MAKTPAGCHYQYMTSKRIPLSTNEYYHVFNRSIAKQPIFDSNPNLGHALDIVNYYRFSQKIRLSKFKLLPDDLRYEHIESIIKRQPLVEIYSFAFMPTHFHFLLKQNKDIGISRFLSNFQNSFAKSFNLINNREGGLFQNNFKVKRITTISEFIHVSRYIHLNPVTSSLISYNQLSEYPFTSYSHYINLSRNQFINTEIILNHFKSIDKYITFVQNQVDYQRQLRKIKRLLIDRG